MEHFRIAIVGTGFAGLGTAIRFKQAGIDDFVVLERAGDVGGTWRDNAYPGCQCDVPSHLYSFSFDLNPGWSRTFSGQPEIWAYLRDCAERHGILAHVRFVHELTDAAWEEDEQRWRLTTPRGELTAQVLVAGVGALSEPSIPALPGLESFEGASFHTAEWDPVHDLTGERVAVIGTGASAIQVVPEIQPKVAHLAVFQRTAPWIMPHPDRPLSAREQRAYRRVPGAQRLMRTAIYWARETFVLGFMHPRLMRIPQRIASRHLARQVPDPDLRRRLTPSYTMGCKRVLLSNDYFPALQRDNVAVVTDAIREVRARSIVTADGTEHAADTIVFGTGFHVTDMPAAAHIRGRDGTLAEEWSEHGMQAHAGTTIAGFPNLFMLLGPNTGTGHNSVVVMIEAQIDYVLACLRAMAERGVASVEVRREAQDAYNARVQSGLRGTVWSTGGCASWYLDSSGRNRTLWPGATWRFRNRIRRFDRASYLARPRSVPAAPAEPAVPATA